MLLKYIKQVEIERIIENKRSLIKDQVITEFPFTINVNGCPLVTLLCTPENLDYLALGYLESEGFIQDQDNIQSINYDQEKGTINLDLKTDNHLSMYKELNPPIFTTGCGKGTTFYKASEILKEKSINTPIFITPEKILNLVNEIQEKATLFQKTGGTHISALASTKEILLVHEDIGRHNALDKVFGECIIDGIDYTDKIIVTSGRISSEMLIKCAKRRISILISRCAATGLSIDLAQEIGITLVGFVREERINIYSHGWRIK